MAINVHLSPASSGIDYTSSKVASPLYLLDLLLLIVIFSSSDSGRSKRDLMISALYCTGLNSECAGVLDQHGYQTATDTCGALVSNVNTVRTLQSNRGLMANQFSPSLLIFDHLYPRPGYPGHA